MWKYYIALLLLLSFASSPSYSQTGSRLSDWTIFSPVTDQFSVDSLVELEEKFTERKDDRRVFSGEFESRWFRVFSVKANEESEWRIITNFVAANGKSLTMPPAKNERSSVSFVDDDGFRHFISAISTKSRVFIAHAITPDTENDRVIGERFANNLNTRETSVAATPNSDSSKLVESKLNSKSQVSGGISGTNKPASTNNSVSANKNSGGIGPGVDGSTPKSEIIAVGMKILSKPRASYTDIARYYEIQGSITIRAKFQADATIGEVQVLNTLPFGLTANAKQSAKRIVFEPAYVNGVPKTVNRTIEYTFTIY